MGRSEPGPWRREAHNFCRAFSGAFLFGIPLLFTMEMWSLGGYTPGWKLLTLLVVALVTNLGLSYFTGFRRDQRRSFGSHVDQAIDTVAVGVVASTVVLLVLNRISLADPLTMTLAKIVVQIVPLSIGASVALDLFMPGQGRQGEDRQRPALGPWQATFKDVGATMAGGIFVGFNIAPTEEIRMLAAELTFGHLVALIGFSLVLTYAVVFESGFDPEVRRPTGLGLFKTPLAETAMAYVVSLVVALGALYLFNEADFGDPLAYVGAQALVLGLPTAIGGAAGRLVI